MQAHRLLPIRIFHVDALGAMIHLYALLLFCFLPERRVAIPHVGCPAKSRCANFESDCSLVTCKLQVTELRYRLQLSPPSVWGGEYYRTT